MGAEQTTEGRTTEGLPPRLVPLLEQFDYAYGRLRDRLAGPAMDSGNGTQVKVLPLTDAELLWEPVPGCWSVRRHADGPGPRAERLDGAGEWGRDAASNPHPWPPPFTTLAWRLSHLAEMLTLRADHTSGTRAMTREQYVQSGTAEGAIAALDSGAAAWRATLTGVDDAGLDTVGLCTLPYGSDRDDLFLTIVWWVNQELLHHAAEIALLRDLYRERQDG
ncbi:DinB family protein [Streptomyces sp. ODS28]|uniref:DinB family protein n=1 Tax=Streptomyces sp. ODS28 TaxID=3136688 RepID=UPI0031E7EB52